MHGLGSGLEFISGAAVSAVLLFFYIRAKKNRLFNADSLSKKILLDAKEVSEREKREMLLRVKEEIYKRKSDFEHEIKSAKHEFAQSQDKFRKKEEHLEESERRIEGLKGELQQKERELNKGLDQLRTDEIRIRNLSEKLTQRLERISNLSHDEAKRILFDSIKEQNRVDMEFWLKKVEEDARAHAKKKSIDILVGTMQRCLPDQVAHHSTSVVTIPNEEMKGKIIGKEGRNIRSLELATGMEFIIGESPDTITISGFNPIRREIARRTLVKLVTDGRINPTKIEETVALSEKEINDEVDEYGKQAVLEFNLHGVHPEMAKLLGKLYFRTSYTQNVWEHSKEVAYFAKMLAAELGLDQNLAARCGLFHDIGKAVSAEVEGPHAEVGANFAKQYGENAIVVNAIAAHHEEVPYISIYGPITLIADAISASRPGARRETLAAYVKRLEKLEEIAMSFEGVKKSYALQAGREIRVIVDEATLDDFKASILAKDLAKRIEEEMNFPGQIKVNVIRESRAIEYAR